MRSAVVLPRPSSAAGVASATRPPSTLPCLRLRRPSPALSPFPLYRLYLLPPYRFRLSLSLRLVLLPFRLRLQLVRIRVLPWPPSSSRRGPRGELGVKKSGARCDRLLLVRYEAFRWTDLSLTHTRWTTGQRTRHVAN